MQEQVDILGMEILEEVEEISERPAEPIDRPGRHHIELPARNRLHHRGEARPALAALGARYAGVLEDRGHPQPWRLATASNSRRWFLVVCSEVLTRR